MQWNKFYEYICVSLMKKSWHKMGQCRFPFNEDMEFGSYLLFIQILKTQFCFHWSSLAMFNKLENTKFWFKKFFLNSLLYFTFTYQFKHFCETFSSLSFHIHLKIHWIENTTKLFEILYWVKLCHQWQFCNLAVRYLSLVYYLNPKLASRIGPHSRSLKRTG